MATDEDFITKVLTVPLTKRTRLPENQRKIQTVGKSFLSLINDMQTNKLDKQLTGYVSFLDEQTNSLVLKITTLKKYEKLLSDFLHRSTKARSAGGAGFNVYGRKNSTIEDADTEYSTFDLNEMSEKKKASLKYNLLSKTGIVAGDDSVTLPSNIPITRKVKNEIRRGSVETSEIQKEYDYVTWKEALDRDRKSRSIFEGKKESELKYQLPENNQYGITQEFVDQQNKQLQQEKLKDAGVGTTKGFLVMLLSSVSAILGVTKKILNYSKQGAEAAQTRTASAQEFALSQNELAAVRVRETELGTSGKGTILNIFKELASNYNAATSLNEKELEKLALLGNASGMDTLIQNGLDVALSGGGVLELFNAMEEAVDEVIAQGIDIVSGKYIGSDEAKRQTANFLGGAWLPYLTQSWAVAQSDSAGNRTGTGVEVTDLTQRVAQAYDVSKSNLEKLLEDLSINLAAWIQQFGILDKIYDLLMRFFSSTVDKEAQKQFARDQNMLNAQANRESAAAIRSTSVHKEVLSLLNSPEMAEKVNQPFTTVSLPGGTTYKPTIKSLLTQATTNDINAFDKITQKQWSEIAKTLGISDEVFFTYMLNEKLARYFETEAMRYSDESTSVNVATPEMVAQKAQADILNSRTRPGDFNLGQLDDVTNGKLLNNIEVTGNKDQQKAAIADVISTGISYMSSYITSPEKATIVNFENNVTINDENGERTYTISKTIQAASEREKIRAESNINGMSGSTYGRGSTRIQQE